MLDDVVTLHFDKRRLQDKIISYFVGVMQKAEDKFAELMREQMPRRVYGDGPGDPAWIPSQQSQIRTVYREIASDYIESGVGLPPDLSLYEKVRAMVINSGAGSAAGNPPIHSKPGQEVWNGDLDGRKISDALTEYDLPDKFNQEGNFYVQNAVKLMSKYFQDILDEASRNMPSEIYSDCLTLSIGGR